MQGRLGIGSLHLRNKVLLMKWLWWFALEDARLRRRVIIAIYGVDSFGWMEKISKGSSAARPWIDIESTRRAFLNFTLFKVKGIIGE